MNRALAPMILILTLLAPASAADQVHTSLANAGQDLVIQWSAGAGYNPGTRTWVEWTDEANVSHTVNAASAGRTINYNPPTPGTETYAATITGIGPGASITYRIFASGQPPIGPYRLTMPPQADQNLRAVAFCDIGTDGLDPDGRSAAGMDPANLRVRNLAMLQSPGLVLVPGDLAYGSDDSTWDRFMRMLEPLAASVPTMPVFGNHEYENDLTGYDQAITRWVLPPDEHHYVFHAGAATFIGLNSERSCHREGPIEKRETVAPCTQGSPNAASAKWLDDALTQAKTSGRQWTIVYFHRPAYSWSNHGSDPAVNALWAPIIERHEVDLVIAAHDHVYQRTYPMKAGQRTDNGSQTYIQGVDPIHIVTGGGGRSLYRIKPDAPDWLHTAAAVHHLVRLDIGPDRLEVHAIEADNGTTIDAFQILKEAPSGPPEPSPSAQATTGVPTLALLLGVALLALAGRRRA
jgi:hypothetical protein